MGCILDVVGVSSCQAEAVVKNDATAGRLITPQDFGDGRIGSALHEELLMIYRGIQHNDYSD